MLLRKSKKCSMGMARGIPELLTGTFRVIGLYPYYGWDYNKRACEIVHMRKV